MKKALAFLFTLASCYCLAQNRFLVYGSGANDSFSKIIRTLDQGWCMVGTTGGELGSQTDLYVVKTDIDFNCIWSLNVGEEGVEIATDAVQLNNGEIVISGYSVNNPTLGYENFLVRISSDGTVLEELRWGNASWNRLHKLTADDSNQLYVIEESFLANGEILYELKYIDSFGNAIWAMPLETSEVPAALEIYQNKLYVVFQENTINGIQPVVHQLELNGTLSGIFNLPDASAIPHGLVVNVFGVAVVGEHPNGSFRNPYTCVFNFDTSISLEQSFNYDYNAWYTVAAPTAEGYTIVGETTSLGLGMADWIVHRTNASCQFINGGTVGSAKNDFVGDVHVVNDSVVVVGSSNGFALNQQSQGVVYFNPSSALSNQDITAEASDCFFVGIQMHEEVMHDSWQIHVQHAEWKNAACGPTEIYLFDVFGRCLGTWKNEIQIPLPRQAGIYFLKYTVDQKTYTQKVVLNP